MGPEQFYTDRVGSLSAQQKKLLARKNLFAVFRFGTVIGIIALFYFLWNTGVLYVVIAAVIIAAIFLRLVYKDIQNSNAITHLGHLIRINEAEISALDGNYAGFENGQVFLPKEHLYAADMDIFGQASLYQFVNRTSSDMGAEELAGWLLNPARPEDIVLRQKAIKELAGKRIWQQELLAYGRETVIRTATLQKLRTWLAEPFLFSGSPIWHLLRIAVPVINTVIIVTTVFDVTPMRVLYGTLLVSSVIAFNLNKRIAPIHEQLSKIVDEIDTLSSSIELIESASFESDLVRTLHENYNGKGKASKKIKKLKRILDNLDLRYNLVLSAPLNIVFLWNLQHMLELERWKKNNAADVENWFSTLGVFEALNSFATIHFNNPDWCFPVLLQEDFAINAKEMGHPLIHPGKRVNNYIQIDHAAEIMLVTGSNMAGKSTYLRSVGVNVVLAMAGAPVAATSFSLSPVQLVSSMRVADNLEESTSTFYAELKKLKVIIDKVNQGEKLFILLDEILRGTNSLDRHTGSVALIRQLIRKRASGIIATHDLGLAEMQKEYPVNMLTYYFDVQVRDEELFFDYVLKPGVCSSLNASLLMKKIGLEL